MTLAELKCRAQCETSNARTSTMERMNEIVIRDAGHDDVTWIVQMIHQMVEHLTRYGGHARATDGAASQKMEAMVADALKGGSTRYLIAQSANGDPLGVAGAELITLGGAFAPKKTIHIHVVYVLPQFRRSGVASALLSQILDWGRTIGAEQCTLNVLANNPAKSLYDKSGFSAFELKLARPLQSVD
jgi:GNAT superfamily N-acetyltransferase